MRLYLLRHPPPVIAPGICYGSSDLPVLPKENAAVVDRVVAHLPEKAALYSSPLVRCLGLADALARARGGMPINIDERLVEMHFGAWELRDWNDIPRGEIDAWCADRLGYRPGGGETVLEATQRIVAFRRDLERRGDEHAIIVCHAGTIRLLQASTCHATAIDIAHHAFEMPSPAGYGEMQILDLH